MRMGGYNVFGADPVGVRVGFHFSALSSELLDFDQTCIDALMGEGEELIKYR